MPREVCEACMILELRGESLRLGLRLRARLRAPAPAIARLFACASAWLASFSRAVSRIFCRSVSPAFDARGSHLLLRALLRDARHLRGEIGVVRRGLVLARPSLSRRLRR